MRRVLTVGVFDYLHIGHVNFLKHAKEFGDYLIVAVQVSELVNRYKPDAVLLYGTDERIFMVGSLRYVDEVVTYEAVDEIVKSIDFDVFAMGPDQNHAGFQRAIKWCEEHDKEIVVIPRTEGISSSQLRSYR